MSNHTVKNIKGIHYESNQTIQIYWEKDKIVRVESIESTEENLPTLVPGFVDLQVNGYKGIDFNHNILSRKDWKKVITSLAEVGTTEFFPTFITNSFEQLKTNFEASEKALDELNGFASFVGGYHLEGPYLSKENGPRGAHNLKFIRDPNWDEFLRLQEAANGKIKLLTLSPEWENSEQFIAKVVNSGVKVGIGHTAANSLQIERAVAAGASLSTHLGNGAHVQLPRHPNYLWDQLSEEELFASVIADGHHLPKNVLSVFNKVKQEKMFLVSDSVALAGMPPGNYNTAVGGEVTLTNEGKLHLTKEERILAGSAQNIWQGIQYLVKENICTFSEAINKASILPRQYISGNSKNDLTVGTLANMVLINSKTNVIETTIKDGNIFYKAGDHN